MPTGREMETNNMTTKKIASGDITPLFRRQLEDVVRGGLRRLSELDGTERVQITVNTPGRYPQPQCGTYDGAWLRWLPVLYPELVRKPEPYDVPDDLEGPETVPWLTARHFSQKTIDRWCRDVFTYEHAQCSLAALILFREEGDLPQGNQPLTDWAESASAKEQADLWNRVMARLGYTEDES